MAAQPKRRWIGPFPLRGLEALLNARHKQVASIETASPMLVDVPALAFGAQMLTHVPVREEFPAPVDYQSRTPWVCVCRDVTVHGPVGILRLEDCVVADTLNREGQGTHHMPRGGGIMLRDDAGRRRLRGTTISLLGVPDMGNYYHWLIDGIGRLSGLDGEMLARCRNVLVAPLRTEMQRSSLRLAGLADKNIVEVTEGEAIAVAELLVPWAPMEAWHPHPGLRNYFARMAETVPANEEAPRRIYVDRRHSSNRRLVNEDEVVAALTSIGFVPVRLESLALEAQIALFRQAECVVGPHGAGLANLVFASPGCRVVELQMDSYLHWCFRVIAALGDLSYDCVIGRQLREVPGTIHGQSWAISVMHVLAAADAAVRAGSAEIDRRG